MKFGVNAPIDHIAPEGEFQTPAAVLEIAQKLDDSGIDACALTDHPAPSSDWLHNTPGGHDALDPFTGLAFLAAATKRIKRVSSIIVLPYRNPFITAKAAALLDVAVAQRKPQIGPDSVPNDVVGIALVDRTRPASLINTV